MIIQLVIAGINMNRLYCNPITVQIDIDFCLDFNFSNVFFIKSCKAEMVIAGSALGKFIVAINVDRRIRDPLRNIG